MNKRWDVLGLGAVAVDDLISVDRFPNPDEKLPARAFHRLGGGLAGTALVAVSRLGGTAAYCGVLSDDELSRFTLDEFEREGVDLFPIQFSPEARPYHSFVIHDLSTGNRTILFYNAGFLAPDPDAITPELITGCKVLFVDQTVIGTAFKAIDIAQAHGIPVVGDIEINPEPNIAGFMAEIDHLITGSGFAGRFTGETDPEAMVRAMANNRRACTAVTAGKNGCWYSQHGGPVGWMPAFPVKVVDTTGCGDVFHGAYAASLAFGYNVKQAILIASAAAALKTRQVGGRAGIPHFPAVKRFLAEQGHTLPDKS
jgi:sulfofructose kinase